MKDIDNIYNETVYSYLWLLQRSITTNNISTIITDTLLNHFFQKWSSDLQNSSKGKTYALFKTIKIRKLSLALSNNSGFKLLKFRTANHKLPIETDRWRNNYANDGKCLGFFSDLGDDFHTFFVSKLFKQIREINLDAYYFSRPNIIKYSQLLISNNESTLKILCRFITYIH